MFNYMDRFVVGDMVFVEPVSVMGAAKPFTAKVYAIKSSMEIDISVNGVLYRLVELVRWEDRTHLGFYFGTGSRDDVWEVTKA